MISAGGMSRWVGPLAPASSPVAVGQSPCGPDSMIGDQDGGPQRAAVINSVALEQGSLMREGAWGPEVGWGCLFGVLDAGGEGLGGLSVWSGRSGVPWSCWMVARPVVMGL